jgi:transcription termination factor Rho
MSEQSPRRKNKQSDQNQSGERRQIDHFRTKFGKTDTSLKDDLKVWSSRNDARWLRILRSSDYNLASPDDIYLSTSQIRLFGLKPEIL